MTTETESSPAMQGLALKIAVLFQREDSTRTHATAI